MPLTKKVTFIAKEGNIDDLKRLLEMMVKPSREEPGCLLYNIYQLKESPTDFVVLESWENEVALEGHKNSDHYKYYKSHFEPFTAEKYSDEMEEIGI